MTQNGNLNNRWPVFVQVREPQKDAREPLFRGGCQQMRYVILIALDAGQQIGD
jgi:hypothetical protein